MAEAARSWGRGGVSGGGNVQAERASPRPRPLRTTPYRESLKALSEPCLTTLAFF